MPTGRRSSRLTGGRQGMPDFNLNVHVLRPSVSSRALTPLSGMISQVLT
jgi:hypothetical protein